MKTINALALRELRAALCLCIEGIGQLLRHGCADRACRPGCESKTLHAFLRHAREKARKALSDTDQAQSH